MLYVIKIEETGDTDVVYHLFDTHTESTFKVTNDEAARLTAKLKLKPMNFSFVSGKIQIKQWPNKIAHYSNGKKVIYSENILLSKLNEDRFKLVCAKEIGKISYCGANTLMSLVEMNKLANCNYIDKEHKIYKSIDTYNTKNNLEFIKSIELKYAEFKAKTALIGLDISFEYIIENEDVKITIYTGKSTKVILPNFITCICKKAFAYKEIKEVKLNERLKFIGNDAFYGNEIDYIEIPENVQFVGQGAFYYNDLDTPFKRVYKKLNQSTIMIT